MACLCEILLRITGSDDSLMTENMGGVCSVTSLFCNIVVFREVVQYLFLCAHGKKRVFPVDQTERGIIMDLSVRR
jgi:hypothetical protein